MKLGPIIKLEGKNTATSKKIDDDVMSANCDIIVFFPKAATRKPDSGHVNFTSSPYTLTPK